MATLRKLSFVNTEGDYEESSSTSDTIQIAGVKSTGELLLTDVTGAIQLSAIRKRSQQVTPIGVDNRSASLNIYEPSPLKVAISSGSVWTNGFTEHILPSFNSTGSDTWTSVYRNGASGYTQSTGINSVNNTSYDSGTGTPIALLPNAYTARYLYYRISNSTWYMVYGITESQILWDIENEHGPSDIPAFLKEASVDSSRIFKIIVQEGIPEIVSFSKTTPYGTNTENGKPYVRIFNGVEFEDVGAMDRLNRSIVTASRMIKNQRITAEVAFRGQA